MKISKKSIFFVVLIVIILLVLGVFFLWMDYEENKKQEEFPIEYIGGYTIEENSEGRFIRNREYGLSFKVPDDWTIKNYDKGGVGIFDSTVEFNEYGGFIDSVREKGGCVFGISIENYKDPSVNSITSPDYLVEIMRIIEEDKNYFNTSTVKKEIINVDGKEGLKTTLFRDKDLGSEHYLASEVQESNINIKIPVGNTVYLIDSSVLFLERCIEHFNAILATVEINK